MPLLGADQDSTEKYSCIVHLAMLMKVDCNPVGIEVAIVVKITTLLVG